MSGYSFNNLFNELAFLINEAFGNYSNQQYTVNPELWKCTREDTAAFLNSFLQASNPVRLALPKPFVKLMISPTNVIDDQEWTDYISAMDSSQPPLPQNDKFKLKNPQGEVSELPECNMTTFQKFKFLGKEAPLLYANVRFIRCAKQLDLLKQGLEHFGLYENGQNPFYYNTSYSENKRGDRGQIIGKEEIQGKGIMLGVVGAVILYSQTMRGNLLASVKGLNQMSMKALAYFPSVDNADEYLRSIKDADIDAMVDGDDIDKSVSVGFDMVLPETSELDIDELSEKYGSLETGKYYYSSDNGSHYRPIQSVLSRLDNTSAAFVAVGGKGNINNTDYREKDYKIMPVADDTCGWDSRSGADINRFRVVGSILRQMDQYAEARKNGTISGDLSSNPPISAETTANDAKGVESSDLLNSAKLEERNADFQQAIETYLFERRDFFFTPDCIKQYWVVGMDDADIATLSKDLLDSDSATAFIDTLKNIDPANRSQMLNMALVIKAAHNAQEKVDSTESSRKSVIDQIFSDCQAKKVLDHDRETIHGYFDVVDKLIKDTDCNITGASSWKNMKNMTGQRFNRRPASWNKGPQGYKTIKGVRSDYDWRNDNSFSQQLASINSLYDRMAMSKDYMEKHGGGFDDENPADGNDGIPKIATAVHYYAQGDYADAKDILGPLVVSMAKLYGEDEGGVLDETNTFIKDLPQVIERMVNEFIKNKYKSMDNSRISSYSADVFANSIASRFGMKKLKASTPVHVNVYDLLKQLKQDVSINLTGAMMQMKGEQDDDSIDFKLVNYIHQMGKGNENITSKKFLFKVGWSDKLKEHYAQMLQHLKELKNNSHIKNISSNELKVLSNKLHVGGSKNVADTEASRQFWGVKGATDANGNPLLGDLRGEDTKDIEDTLLSVFKLLINGLDAFKEYKEIYGKIKNDYDAFVDELNSVFRNAPTQTMHLFVKKNEIKPADGVQPTFAEFAPSFDDYRDGVFIKEYVRRLTNWCRKSDRMRALTAEYKNGGNGTFISTDSIAKMAVDAWNTLLDGSKKIKDSSNNIKGNAVAGTGNFNDADLSVAAWVFGQNLTQGVGNPQCDVSKLSDNTKKSLLGAFFNKFWVSGKLGEARDIEPPSSENWTPQWEEFANHTWSDSDSDSILEFTLHIISYMMGGFLNSYRIRSYMNHQTDTPLDDYEYGQAEAFSFDMSLLSKYKYEDEQQDATQNAVADDAGVDNAPADDGTPTSDDDEMVIPDDNGPIDSADGDDDSEKDLFDVNGEDDEDETDDDMPI